MFSKKPIPACILFTLVLVVPGSGPGVAGQELPLDPRGLPTGRWTYRVVIGGIQAGELTSTISRDDSTITSRSDMRGVFIQRGSVTVDALSLRPIRSQTFIYETAEGSTNARLNYRARGDSVQISGEVTWARLSEPREPLSINRTAAGELFDNQSLDLVIGALPLQRNRSWRIALFEPTTFHETIMVTIDVRAHETVSTPAGRFETWRVDVRGFSDRVTYWIDDGSRLVIAQEAAGRDLRLELVTPPRQQGESDR